MKNEDFLYVEKYRPQKVEDCVLPSSTKSVFEGYVRSGIFPNLLLSGSAGTGKTTIAKALCKELDYSFIVINASDERNIDVVRNTIKDFASTRSLTGQKKAIILDEADGLTAIAQGALRGSIEQYPHVRFILTCNFPSKIIEPIHSRLSVVNFSVKESEKKELMGQMLKIIFGILKKENVEFDQKAVAEVVKRFYPDNRKILNDLQKYSIGGKIDSGILAEALNIEDLLGFIKDRDTVKSREWIVKNSDVDVTTIFTSLYEAIFTKIAPASRPSIIPLIAQYQMYSSQVSNQEINLAALVYELMLVVEWA